MDATILFEGRTFTGTLSEVSPLSDEIKMIWITDSHTRPDAPHYPERRVALNAAIADANTWGADYFLHTGDMASGNSVSFDYTFNQVKDNINMPFLWCLGNHDEEEYSYGLGNPNTAKIELVTGLTAPFYFSQIIQSADSSLKALVITMDCNFYEDDPAEVLISPNHQPGDRIGTGPGIPSGGYYRRFGAGQLNWVTSELAANQDCNAIIFLIHYLPVGQRPLDFPGLGDIMNADNRPKITLSGHRHQDAKTWTILDSADQPACTIYKMLALQDCLGHCRLRVAYENGQIVIREASIIANGPINGEIITPFTVA